MLESRNEQALELWDSQVALVVKKNKKWKWKSPSCVRLFVTPWSVHGILQARMLEGIQVKRSPFPSPGDLPNPGIKPRTPTLQADSLPAETQGKPKNTKVGSLSLLQGISQPRYRTVLSCIAGGFFTNWAIRVNAGDVRDCGFNPWVGTIPWRRAWKPTPVFLPGESHGQRSLVGYSPYRPKESGRTKGTWHA